MYEKNYIWVIGYKCKNYVEIITSVFTVPTYLYY